MFAVLVVVWMIIIFSFSSRPSEVSTNDSNRIGFLIGKVFVPGFEEWSEAKQMTFAKAIDHPIRKTAHAVEYAILGSLLVGAYIDSKRKRSLCILVPWAIGALYAASDECHQLFVPGRSGQVSDVLLDSTGVLCGVVLIVLLYGVSEKRRVKRQRL